MAYFTVDKVNYACVMILLKIIFAVSFVNGEETVTNYCPEKGMAHQGHWRLQTDDDGLFCELKCHHGYSPSGCTILRKDRFGDWKYDIPTCEEDARFSLSKFVCKVAKYTPGFALGRIGFSKKGIIKNSFAAKLMKWLINFAVLFSVGFQLQNIHIGSNRGNTMDTTRQVLERSIKRFRKRLHGKVEKESIFARIQSAAMKGYYPVDVIEDICNAITEYLTSRSNCETPRGKTEF